MTPNHSFRQRYRREQIPRRYSGRVHLGFTIVASLVLLAGALWQLDGVRPAEWLVVPATFLYANIAEYLGHRFPMHRPLRGAGLLFRRHVGHHHRFFTATAMAFRDTRDYHAVLFPPVMIAFFLGVLAPPFWLLVYWLWSANAAWLAVGTAIAYFLNYELLHFAYHCDPAGRIGRLPGVARLRRLHHTHHDPRRMSTRNFNITYPLGDWLFGTLDRSGSTVAPSSHEVEGTSSP